MWQKVRVAEDKEVKMGSKAPGLAENALATIAE